ncbi:unnamed protein product [Brassica oleracea]
MSKPTTETNNIKPVRNLVSTPVTIYLTGGLLIILTGFFSFFFCGSFLKKLLNIWNNLRNRNRPSNLIQPSIPPEHAGLGSKIIQSFPEFPYSVKDQKQPAIPEVDLVTSESHEERLSRDPLTTIVHEEHPTTTTIGINLDQTDDIENYERRMKEPNLRFWRSHSTGHSIVVKTETEQAAEEKEKEEFNIHIEISGECQFEDHMRNLPNRNLYCVRGTYSVG